MNDADRILGIYIETSTLAAAAYKSWQAATDSRVSGVVWQAYATLAQAQISIWEQYQAARTAEDAAHKAAGIV